MLQKVHLYSRGREGAAAPRRAGAGGARGGAGRPRPALDKFYRNKTLSATKLRPHDLIECKNKVPSRGVQSELTLLLAGWGLNFAGCLGMSSPSGCGAACRVPANRRGRRIAANYFNRANLTTNIQSLYLITRSYKFVSVEKYGRGCVH